MNTDSSIVNGLDKVRISERERAIAKAYVEKVEAILDFVWPAGAKTSSATRAGRRAKTGKE